MLFNGERENALARMTIKTVSPASLAFVHLVDNLWYLSGVDVGTSRYLSHMKWIFYFSASIMVLHLSGIHFNSRTNAKEKRQQTKWDPANMFAWKIAQ